MKHTNTKAFKELAYRHLIDGAYDCDDMTDAEIVRYIHDRWVSEYCFPANLIRYPNHVQRLAEWLRGLPLNIAYTNYDIVQTAQEWHVYELTDTQAEKVIDGWFDFMAFKCMQLFREHGIDV